MTPPLRVVLVDDEDLARDRLDRLCRRLEGVQVVGHAASGAQALEQVAALSPDVLLLDISMPGLDGVQTALAVSKAKSPPAVIFVTAHDRFAVRAFDIAARDYLLKPVELERLERALQKCRPNEAGPAAPARPATAFVTEFWAPKRGGLARVRVEALRLVEAERDYVRLHTADSSYLLRSTLADLIADLDPDSFMRVHRSFVVARTAVVALTTVGGDYSLGLEGGRSIPVGRTYAKAVKAGLSRP